MIEIDVRQDMIRRLLDCAVEAMTGLDPDRCTGWGVYFLETLDALYRPNGNTDLLPAVKRALDDRLASGQWE